MRFLPMILLAGAIALLIGCGDDDPPATPQYGFWDDPGSNENGCCGVNHAVSISGVAPPGGAYYFLALVHRDTLILRGNPVWINEGAYVDKELNLTTSHLDNLPTDEYQLCGYAIPSLEELENAKGRIIVSNLGIVAVPDYADSSCSDCCSRDGDDPNGERSRRHCVGARDVGDLIGVQADIRTRLGRLCGSGSSDEYAQSNAFVYTQDGSIVAMTSGMIQSGWMRYRPSGSTHEQKFVYVEWKGPSDTVYEFTKIGPPNLDEPQNGEDHNYMLEWDNGQKMWTFSFDGIPIIDVNVDSWQTSVGRWAAWSTEIVKRETDMPGTANDPCVFGQCQYRKSGENWVTMTFTEGTDTVRCSGVAGNPIEWNILGRNDTLFVWDVYPYGQ
jgi:hypothetical protein